MLNGRAAWEACSATWNLGTNSEFALGPREITDNLDRVGRSQDPLGANWLLASSPALNTQAYTNVDRLCGLLVRVLGYRSGGPGSIPGTTRKIVVGLERGALSLVSTTEELLDRKVAAPV
jgi:hypothetical protein